MKIYFISDTHFSHQNIIEYCNRPFNNIDEMNEHMIYKWNSVISKDDIVYHLGDFMLDKKDNLANIFNKLNGKIYLIKGNHDRKSTKYYEEIGFKVLATKTKLEKFKFILSHRPLSDAEIPNGYINIHGHIHNKELDTMFDKEKHKCVSVELINYTPIEINKLKEM